MSEENHIRLKESCILSVPVDTYGDDFIFNVNGKDFKTNRLISDLISPKICHFHSIDPTIANYSITTQSEGDFSHILQLVNFKNNQILEEELEFITEVIEQLESESIEITMSNQDSNLTTNNVIDLLKLHQKHPKFFSQNISKEIDYISSNFNEIVKKGELIEILPLSTIELIIKSDKLKLEDEDQLIQFVNKLYRIDRSNCILYEYVNFSNLTITGITEFLSIFDINDLNNSIWISISNRLQKVAANTKSDKRYVDKSVFNKEGDDKFNGIFAGLRKKNDGQNPALIGLVSITASSKSNEEPYVLLDSDSSKLFGTENVKGSFIKIDFKTKKVSLNGYSLKTHSVSGNGHITGWILLGSNDNLNWNKIDSVDYTDDFDSVGAEKFYKLKSEALFYRYFILKQVGLNTKGFNNLRLDRIEFFGSIY